MDVVWSWLQDNNIIAILISIIVSFLNLILVNVRTRKTNAEKEFIKAQKQLNSEFYPADYLALVNGRYYSIDEITFIKKDDVSIDEYLSANGKEVISHEKENV